jgi:hypothetical protein
MNLCDHYVMCSVGYRLGLDPQAVARHSWGSSEGDPRGDFPLSAHRTAVGSCVAKGWLTVLTADDADREEERRRTSDLPELTDHGVTAGAADFTQSGFDTHRSIIGTLFGDAHLSQADAGWNHLEGRSRFEVYAPTLDLCRRIVVELAADVEVYCGSPAVVTGANDPQAIGPWRPNRFVIRPAGYRAGLVYRVH